MNCSEEVTRHTLTNRRDRQQSFAAAVSVVGSLIL